MKKYIYLLIVALTVTTNLMAQQSSTKDKAEAVYNETRVKPLPKGGMEAFDDFVRQKMAYPKVAEEQALEGIVVVQAEVTKQGKIKSAYVVKGVAPEIDQEALRLVYLSEQELGWVPGQEKGRNVKMERVVFVKFEMPERAVLTNIDLSDNKEAPLQLFSGTPVPAPREQPAEGMIFHIVEEEATPVGGTKKFYTMLEENMQYPEKALKFKIEGIAYVRFIINEQGTVETAEIVEGRELGYGMDEEAIRLIKSSKWIPAKQREIAVKQTKILPVKFKLPKE